MQYYNIAVKDNIAEKFLALLNNFSKSDIKVEKVVEQSATPTLQVNSIDELYGILSPYVQGRLSDEDIENAIVEGAYERAMKGKTV